jgi:hypothetical protein
MNAFIFLRPDHGMKIAGLLLATAVCFYCYTGADRTDTVLRARTNHNAIAHDAGKSAAKLPAYAPALKFTRTDASRSEASAGWQLASR